MAKPRPITGIDPSRRLRRNARRILATRIDEVWAFHPQVLDPQSVVALHDLRIACKRLRYLLEIFAVAFEDDLSPYIAQVKDLQGLLGEIHDRDVQIPALRDHLERLDELTLAAAHLARRQASGAPPPPRRETRETELMVEAQASGAPALGPGIHALLARRGRERSEYFDRFVAVWQSLHETGFRERLERALTVRA